MIIVLFAAGAQYEKDIKERPLDILPKLLLLSEMFPQDKIDTVSKEILKFYCGSKPIDRNTTQGIIDVRRKNFISLLHIISESSLSLINFEKISLPLHLNLSNQ